MNKPYKQKVSVSLDEDVITKIRELADNDDRSFSQYINLVLNEHIEKIKIFFSKHHSEKGAEQAPVPIYSLSLSLFLGYGRFSSVSPAR